MPCAPHLKKRHAKNRKANPGKRGAMQFNSLFVNVCVARPAGKEEIAQMIVGGDGRVHKAMEENGPI